MREEIGVKILLRVLRREIKKARSLYNFEEAGLLFPGF